MTAPTADSRRQDDLEVVARARLFLGHIEDMPDDEKVFLLGYLSSAVERLRSDNLMQAVEEANQGPLGYPLSVTFAYPDAGYDAECERASFWLQPGRVYQVHSLTVGQSDSWLELYGMHGRFSTAFFAPYWDPPEDGDPEPGPRAAPDPRS